MRSEHPTSGSRRALLIFTRHPSQDARRKQLFRDPAQHQAIYRYFIRHLLDIARSARTELDFDIIFASDEADRANLQSMYAAAPKSVFRFIAHQARTFDDNFKHALQSSFGMGYQQVAVIGNDCLDLSPEILLRCFRELEPHNFTVGAAKDGGFYLLGLKQYSPAYFAGIHWGSHTVLATLCGNLRQNSRTIACLPHLEDIDSANDLRHWLLQALRCGQRPQKRLALQLAGLLQKSSPHRCFAAPGPGAGQSHRQYWQLPPPNGSTTSRT